VEHNHVLHDHVIVLPVETVPAPYVAEGMRIHVDALGHKDDRTSFVSAKFGYMDPINVPSLLPLIRQAGLERPLNTQDVSLLPVHHRPARWPSARPEPVARAAVPGHLADHR
jgi:KUP system potassium uptake protein